MVVAVSGRVPELTISKTEADRRAAERMLEYMGLKAGTRDRRNSSRPRLHRLVHQLAPRRPARRRPRRQGTSRKSESTSDGRSRLAGGQTCGRTGRPAPDFPGSRFRMAGVRMLDVPGNESRHPATRRTLRFHQQPQLRRTPGTRWTHSPGQSHDGRGGRHRRPLHRHSQLASFE